LSRKAKAPVKKLNIIPLGGLREVGKNMTAFEYGNDIILIDCGMSFPSSDMYGIDAVLPCFDYVIENASRIRGLLLTHAHEDHIGGVTYLLQSINVPVLGSPLTIGFVKNRLRERKIQNVKFIELQSEDEVKLGCFAIEAIHITHSVADSFSFAIYTPVGLIFHTGDFKIDYTPIDGETTDLARLAQIGDEGVLLLMADSTNAEKKGYSKSERTVNISLSNIFKENQDKRIIITTFSSNVHRVQMIVNCAVENGRKVAIVGRSMENMVDVALELGYLTIPVNTRVTLKQSKHFNPNEIVIITTGTQGEPHSALTRISAGQHKDIKITKDDLVILSSSVVPGNELNVSEIINSVMELGGKILYNDIAEIHASGHANQEELKLMHALIRPQYFMPIHGEIRQLISHSEIAQNLGMSKNNIIIASNGDIVEVSKGKVKLSQEHINADPVLVDGNGIGDVGSVVLNERKALSQSGVIVLSAVFDTNGDLISGPEIKTKGLIYVKEYGDLLERAIDVLNEKIDNAMLEGLDRPSIEKMLVDILKTFIFKQINRNPVIIPVFMEV